MMHKKKTYVGFSDSFEYCEACGTKDFSLACKQAEKVNEKPAGLNSGPVYSAMYANYTTEFWKDVNKGSTAPLGGHLMVPMLIATPFSHCNPNTPVNVTSTAFIVQPAPPRTMPNLFTGPGLSLCDWIPEHAPGPNDHFLGVNRSIDVIRLAGIRYSSPMGIQENILDAIALLCIEGETPTNAYMHPDDFQDLLSDLGMNLKDRALMLNSHYGSILVKPDCDCPADFMYVMDINTWTYDLTVNQLYTNRPQATCVVKL